MDTFLTILNYIGMGFMILIGIATVSTFKDYKQWPLFYVLLIIIGLITWKLFNFSIPYAFGTAAFITGLWKEKYKPKEGTYSEEYEKRHEQKLKEYTEKYRKEHPINYDSTLRSYKTNSSSSSNNSPSLASYFEHQQKATNEFMQKRLQTMADIRAGQAPNGTDGVWQ